MDTTTFIYTLEHPLSNAIRYVGKSDNPPLRLKTHYRKEKTAKSRWVQSLAKVGLLPRMEVLAEVPFAEWQLWEQYWIAQLKAWGCDLLNGDNGGLGHFRLTAELRAKISTTLRGRECPNRRTPYAQYSLSGKLLHVWESRTAASKALGISGGNITGKQSAGGYVWKKYSVGSDVPESISTPYVNGVIPLSAEARAKISASSANRKRMPFSQATRQRMRMARLGKSPANKGIPATEANKQLHRALSKSKKGVIQLSRTNAVIREWSSVKHASQSIGLARCSISKCANGVLSLAGGFAWRWA